MDGTLSTKRKTIDLTKWRKEEKKEKARRDKKNGQKRQKEESKVIKEVKNNPKAFYKYESKYRKSTCKIRSLRETNK